MPATTDMRILLAEDNSTNQKIATLVLNKMGYQMVDVANNGREAVNAAMQQIYDVILMDVEMPELDGFAATSEIRQQSACGNPYIIAMTGHTAAGYREKCIAAGMNDYVKKPINREELRIAIERAKI